MITIFTQTTFHFAKTIQTKQFSPLIKKFSDGELYVRIDKQLSDETVWIISSTQSPGDNLIELFLLLDALTRTGVKNINLFFTYFGYARQAIAQKGEACSAQLICSILSQFSVHKIYSMDTHNASVLQNYLPYTNLIDYDFFCSIAQSYDAIASPDKGSYKIASVIAQKTNKELIELHKVRPKHEQVSLKLAHGLVADKKVLLIDDMISTGKTLVEASALLHQAGAGKIAAAATHGIFAHGAYERLEKSVLHQIYITNSIVNASKGKIQVHDISNFIKNSIQAE